MNKYYVKYNMLKRFYAILLLEFIIHVCLFNYKVFALSSDNVELQNVSSQLIIGRRYLRTYFKQESSKYH
jgi:hypothetical protein